MAHSTATVNGIDVETWDDARRPAEVKSQANRLAGALPRNGDIEGHDGEIDRVEGPASAGGDMTVWFKGTVVNFEAPDGYHISQVSVFDGRWNCVTITSE